MKAKEFQRKIRSGEIVSTKKGLVTKAFLQPQLSEKTTDILTGNVKVKNAKKVDFNLEVIKTSIPEWKKDHPNEMYFDSLIEGRFYKFLEQNNIPFIFKEKIVIIEKFEFYNKKNGSLTWQPDFQIKVPNAPLIILDTKGYPNESFPIKLKLLQFKYYCAYRRNEIHLLPHIWFIKTNKMFPVALNCINRVTKNQPLDGIETVLLFNEQRKKKKK